jgi:ubiquinone/menaquinone biosynthesis C-methylase UbiE
MNRPNWFYDEYKYAGVDYANPEQVAVYDARHQRFRDYRKFAENIMNRLALGADATVIDLGVGTGAFALNAAPHYKMVYAVDVSDAMLSYTRAKAELAGLENIAFRKGGFLTYEHVGAPADGVVSSAVLHHLPDMWKWAGLLNVAKMLKPGGKFYLFDVVFPMMTDYAAAFGGWVDTYAAKVGPEFAKEVETHVRDEFSTFDWVMEGMLRRAGFRIDSADYGDSFGATYLCTKE